MEDVNQENTNQEIITAPREVIRSKLHNKIVQDLKNSKKKAKSPTFDKLLALISEETDYAKYEVEDVLTGLRIVASKLMIDGIEVKLEHFVTLAPRYNPPVDYIIDGRTGKSSGSISVRVKSSIQFDRLLNEQFVKPSTEE